MVERELRSLITFENFVLLSASSLFWFLEEVRKFDDLKFRVCECLCPCDGQFTPVQHQRRRIKKNLIISDNRGDLMN